MPKKDYLIKINSTTLVNFKRHKKIVNQHSVVYYKTTRNEPPRLGVAISKKAIKLAVIRNLIKRRVTEDFKIKSKNLNNIQILMVISNKIYSEKNEISDILMQEWTQSIKSLSRPHQQ